jgi:formate hydrogenlyase subunit 4
MIHEVMVLDHSGPDLAFILYSSSLKFWILASLLARILFPFTTGNVWIDQSITILGTVSIAIVVGLVECSMARLRMPNVPQLLLGAGMLSMLALLLGLR